MLERNAPDRKVLSAITDLKTSLFTVAEDIKHTNAETNHKSSQAVFWLLVLTLTLIVETVVVQNVIGAFK